MSISSAFMSLFKSLIPGAIEKKVGELVDF